MIAVKSLCEKAVMLENGIIKKIGSAKEVISYYLQRDQMSSGKIEWDEKTAPGDSRIKIKKIEVVSEGKCCGTPAVNKEIIIKLTYMNFVNNARRLVSFHILNSMNQQLFTSANMKSASSKYDPWVEKKYPIGLFSTSCTIPANLLNPGKHSIDLYLNETMDRDTLIFQKNIITFDVKESSEWRTDYLGAWVGAVRPKLLWKTEQIT